MLFRSLPKELPAPAVQSAQDTLLRLGAHQNVLLTPDELRKLEDDYPDLHRVIEWFLLYLLDKDYATRSPTHAPALRRWVVRAYREQMQRERADASRHRAAERPVREVALHRYGQRQYTEEELNALFYDTNAPMVPEGACKQK